MNKEKKFIGLAEFKEVTTEAGTGTGGFSGYANNFGVLDCYDDITLPGCFAETIPQFMETGFSAPDHEWGICDELGIITEAKEDEVGLMVTVAYHPDDESQAIRQKINHRLENGKKVSLSIGYSVDECEYVVGEEAAKFLINPPQDVLDYLKQREPIVRLLKKVTLYEVSVVSVGANQDSAVFDGKSADKARERIQAARKSGDNELRRKRLLLKFRAISVAE